MGAGPAGARLELRDSRNGKDPDDAGSARGQQDAAAFGHRGPGGEDVVDEEHVDPRYCVGTAEDKGSPHVGSPLLSGELGLRASDPDPPKDAFSHRDFPLPRKPTGKEKRLVEPTLSLPARVKRHRDQTVHRLLRQHGLAGLGEEVAQRTGQAGLPAELEGVECFPDRVAVERRGSRISESWRPPLTGLAKGGPKPRGLLDLDEG